MASKTGDVIVTSMDGHVGKFRAINLRAGFTEVSSEMVYFSKRAKLLNHNADTVRQLYATKPAWRRL